MTGVLIKGVHIKGKLGREINVETKRLRLGQRGMMGCEFTVKTGRRRLERFGLISSSFYWNDGLRNKGITDWG